LRNCPKEQKRLESQRITIASGASEAMLYLIGWTRSGSTSTADDALQTNGGVWTTIERP